MRTKLEKPLSRKYTREKAAEYSKETGLFVSRCDPLTLLMDFIVCVFCRSDTANFTAARTVAVALCLFDGTMTYV